MDESLTKPEIPPSLDEHGHKKIIIPAEVKGKYRNARNWTQAVLILFFLLLPWISINGQQALLLNIAGREFAFFGLKFYAYDAPLVFFIFAIAAFGLIFLTAVWGRIWCGWACPQTVFIDGVFRRIEILTEGTYLKRRANLRGPLTFSILARKSLKWFLFFVASSIIAHSFIAVFVGSHQLLEMMSGDPRQNWIYFLLISSITTLVLFDFGWFREQFCIIMCPYGRFQSALMDSTSMAVTYDVARGEPRRGLPTTGEKKGDCVSCRRCVEVCPTGIDIRNGLQMDCIACTACMDACDEIMVKVNKPKGLIRYANTEGKSWVLKKPKALFCLAIVLLCTLLLVRAVAFRADIDVSVLRGQDALFQDVSVLGKSPRTANHFRLHIKNQTSKNLSLRLTATEGSSGLEIATLENPIPLPANSDREIHFFIKFPTNLLHNGSAEAELSIEPNDGSGAIIKKLHLAGPLTP